jgi:predicted ATP-grasp superfamily ATP-dependent carboligase
LGKHKKKDEEKKKDLPNFTPRRRIVRQFVHGMVALREFEAADNCGGIFVEGFQDESMAGFLTASLICDNLNLPIIAEIDSHSFPFVSVLREGNTHGGCRLFGNENVVVGLSEYKFGPELAKDVLVAVRAFCQRHNIRTIVLIESSKEELTLPPGTPPPRSEMDVIRLAQEMMEKKMEEEPKARFVTTSETLANRLVELECEPLHDALIGGISAGFLHYCTIYEGPEEGTVAEDKSESTPEESGEAKGEEETTADATTATASGDDEYVPIDLSYQMDVVALVTSYLPIMPDGKNIVTCGHLISGMFPNVALNTEELDEHAKEMQGEIRKALGDILDADDTSGSSSPNMAMYM